MAESGIFGQTPAAIRAAMAQERLGNASLIGRMGPGGHGALAGLALGQGVAGMFGAEDPRLKQAQELQNIEQEISQLGLEPGTPEFTRETVGRIRSRLGEQAAIQAWQMAVQLEQQRAEVEAVRNPPEVASTRNREAALKAIGMSEDAAKILAPIKEVAFAILKQEFSPAQADEIVARALWATNGDEKEARRIVRKKMEGRPLVQITNEGKAAQISAETRAREETKRDVASESSKEEAGPVLKEYVNLIRSRPPATDVVGLVEWGTKVKAMELSAGQALAKLRNPQRVTDDDVRQAMKALPGLATGAMGQLETSVRSIELETGIDLGGNRAPRPVPKRFQEGQTATNPKTGERVIFRDGAWQKL